VISGLCGVPKVRACWTSHELTGTPLRGGGALTVMGMKRLVPMRLRDGAARGRPCKGYSIY
jgi:hypothetical protein